MWKALRAKPELSAFGVLATLAGALTLALMAPSISRDISRIEELAPLDRPALLAAAPGSAVLVQGRIGPDMAPRFRDFVAYLRWEYRGQDPDKEDIWRQDERHLPPLSLLLPGGAAQVTNSGYALSQGTRFREWPLYWNPILRRGTRRYEGLVAGGPVLVFGVKGQEGAAVEAALVAAGDKDSYLQARRSERLQKRLIGAGLLAAGLIALGLCLRAARRAAAAADPEGGEGAG